MTDSPMISVLHLYERALLRLRPEEHLVGDLGLTIGGQDLGLDHRPFQR